MQTDQQIINPVIARAYRNKSIAQLARIIRRAIADCKYCDTGARRFDPIGDKSPRSSRRRISKPAAMLELAKALAQLPQRNIGGRPHRNPTPRKITNAFAQVSAAIAASTPPTA